MMKKLLSLLLVLWFVCAACACAEISVTDTAGRKITLEAPASRIIALTPADCEILCALGMESTLIGRGAYCNYPESVLSLPAVQSGSEMNIEEILALQPQVVLMGTGFDTLELAARLEKLGVCAVMTGADSIAETYEIIGLIGALTGRETEAGALIARMQDTFSAIAQRAPKDGRTVYFEISPLAYGLFTAGSGTFMDELAALCGAQNIFSDVNGWAQVSEEQVLLRNPDYILTTTMPSGADLQPDEEIKARAGWENLAAVKNNKVFAIDSDVFSRPGPRLMDAALLLDAFINGEE